MNDDNHNEDAKYSAMFLWLFFGLLAGMVMFWLASTYDPISGFPR